MKIVVPVVALSILAAMLSALMPIQAHARGELTAPGSVDTKGIGSGSGEVGNSRVSLPDASHHMGRVVYSDVGDYEADDAGLVDVASLKQFDAIRWDLDSDESSDDPWDFGTSGAFPKVAVATGVVGGIPPAEAQGRVVPTTNIEAREGSQPGEVIISWDAAPQATHYRIGYVNMEVDYHFAKASCTGEWIEAFVYVDVNAQNISVNDGRAEYTLRRVDTGARHAFTVLVSNDFVDTGGGGSVSSEFFWPPIGSRWAFLPGRNELPPGVTIPMPDCSRETVEPGLVPPAANITAREGSQPGEVIISWDAAPQATHYRIGYVNMEVDYHFAKASCTGEWIEAFVYVDVNAQNISVNDGRAEYTLRRVDTGARHAFTVLVSNDFVDTGGGGSVSSEFFWPPIGSRWAFLPGRNELPPGVTIPMPDSPPAPEITSAATDRAALVALYHATGGPHWHATGGPHWPNNYNWLRGPVDEWHGVRINEAGRVTGLWLPRNNLIGEIPEELGNLTKLQSLDLSGNQLSGDIPAELGSLPDLRWLDLSHNRLSGVIPPELGRLSRLVDLDLSGNQLSGEIPAQLCSLSDLQGLSLYSNQLIGGIPPALGSVAKLEELHLWRNQLSGEIPAALGNLSNLRTLDVHRNQLSGVIPSELGRLSQLQELALHSNQLLGEIPAELSSLSGLQRLTLGHNRLNGRIPAELGRLSNLEFLAVNGNQLSEGIPEEFVRLSNLRWLWLSDNRLTGGIPAELGSLNLEQLDLSGNQLVGCIPESLRDVLGNDSSYLGLTFCAASQSVARDRAALIELYNSAGGPSWTHNDNWLSDAPMGEWYGVTTDDTDRVAILDLMENQLRGEIPEELGDLSSLQLLTLSGNALSGCIPALLRGVGQNDFSELGLPFCTQLHSDNLDGAVLDAFYYATGGPGWTEAGNWVFVRPLAASFGIATDDAGRVIRLERIGNELRGSIPPELGTLSRLEELRLSDNQLGGEIPVELGNLSNLRFMAINNNQLEGEMPRQFGRLLNLRWLVLSNNQLSGRIPVELGGLTGLEALHLSGNQLSGEIPSELSRLSDLEELVLSGNRLTGTIPPELGNLPKLQALYLSGNQLSGCIPASLSGIKHNDFSDLGLPFCTSSPSDSPDRAALIALYNSAGDPSWTNNVNWLSDAPISEWYGVATDNSGRVTGLQLSYNQLDGEIPEELGTLASLQALYLSGNEWSGCIPLRLNNVEGSDLSDLGLPLCTPTQRDNSDRAALVALYNATGGPSWAINSGWLSDAPLDEWYGVRTDSTGRVTALQLDRNHLSGEVPKDLGNLVKLKELDLSDNQLRGEIPAELTNLINLEALDLEGNRLVWKIPRELGRLINLGRLDLKGNRLSGDIPGELGSLPNLESLDLSSNRLIGQVPRELGNLFNLETLELEHNHLVWKIPGELGNLSNLVSLNLRGNRLDGPTPAGLGRLLQLRNLELPYNRLSGAIPGEVGSLSNLRTLYLHDNYLSGEIPTELGLLTNLSRFELARNRLGGNIPPELGNLLELTYLSVSDNQLTGEIPAELGSLPRLWALVLDDNRLGGAIPSELGNLTRLEWLHLSNNRLSGRIPGDLGNLTSLEWLSLDNNRLTGAIPPELGNLINLELLYLGGNDLSGCVPESIKHALGDAPRHDC